MVKKIPSDESKIDKPTKIEEDPILNEYQLVDTSFDFKSIRGLTSSKNRELEGVPNPPESVLSESRIGDNGALQIQADYFQETIIKQKNN